MLTIALWIMLAAAFLGCLVSALHYALRDFSVVRLQSLIEIRGPSHLVESVLDDVDGHAHAAGAMRVLCNVAISLAAVVLLDVFTATPIPAAAAASAGDGDVTIHGLRLGIAFAVAASIIYLFGLVIPMSLAEHMGERLIFSFAGPLKLLYWVAWPIRALSFIDTAIRRLTGVEHMTEEEKLEEQIISVVAEGEREGQLGETQRDMIEAVVDFKDRSVDQIMTPRTEIEGFEYTDDLGFIQRFIQQHGHSRIPVYQGDLDHIVGVLYAKDLIRFLGTEPSNFKLKPILRRPVWVPETKPLMELLYELRARKVHMAIVADEYGGTAGLVTFEDLLEEIVGEIQDEYELAQEAAPEIEVKQDAGTADIDARAYVHDVNEALEALGVEVPQSEEYDTVAGYVLAKLGHIPEPGESFRDGSLAVTVLGAEATRVTRIRIEAIPRSPDDEGDASEERQPEEPVRGSDRAEPRIAGA